MGCFDDAADKIARFVEDSSAVRLDETKNALKTRFVEILQFAVPAWLSNNNLCEHDKLKSLHAVYALITLHKQLIKPELSRSTSNVSYLRSYGVASAGDQYYTLLQSLSEDFFRFISLSLPKTILEKPRAHLNADIASAQRAFPSDATVLKIRLSTMGNLHFVRRTIEKQKKGQYKNAALSATVTGATMAVGGLFVGLITTPITAPTAADALNRAAELGDKLKLTPQTRELDQKWSYQVKTILSPEYSSQQLQTLFSADAPTNPEITRAHLKKIQAVIEQNDIHDFPELLCDDCFAVKELRKDALPQVVTPTPIRLGRRNS